MKIRVPATSANLGPGFDSLGLALNLYNTIHIEPAKESSMMIKGYGQDNIRIVKNDIFTKIFTNTLQQYGDERNFSFTLNNSIPISRGLGSSSAIIVGAIYSALSLVEKNIDKQKVLDIALKYEKHPDNITPATFGGFCVSALKYYMPKFEQNVLHKKIDIPDSIRAVVVIPNKAMNTKLSRKALSKNPSMKDCVFNLSHTALIVSAFFSRDFTNLRIYSMDRLHQNIRMRNYPLLFSIQKVALANGALSSTLSGSGSTLLNICYKDDASNLQKILQDTFPRLNVLELEFDNIGVTCLKRS